MRSRVVAAGIALSLIGACRPAPNFAGLTTGPRRASFQDRILARKLSNGLRVGLLPDARTNLVTVAVRYDVGGADDPPSESGLAHYAEHLLWEAVFRDPDNTELRDVALDGNAMTGLDRTYFFATALDVDLDRELEIAARRLELTCDALDPDTVARERDVVIEELKLRSAFRWNSDIVQAAIWGPNHPYAHRAGGDGFADVARPALCAFIDQHYGPSSATLVVTGHVGDDAMQRIQARFEAIPARAQARRVAVHPSVSSDARVVVPGLEKPTAVMVLPFPGEGSEFDGVATILTGMPWYLGDDTPTYFAHTMVIGEERSRAIVAVAETDDASDLQRVAAAMRRAFTHPGFVAPLSVYQRGARTSFVEGFDEPVRSGLRIADLLAQNQRLTRYRTLQQIDTLTEAKVLRWLEPDSGRFVMLVPEGKADGTHHVAELATDLHHVEVSRTRDSGDTTPPALPATPPQRSLIDYQLPNGLRV